MLINTSHSQQEVTHEVSLTNENKCYYNRIIRIDNEEKVLDLLQYLTVTGHVRRINNNVIYVITSIICEYYHKHREKMDGSYYGVILCWILME